MSVCPHEWRHHKTLAWLRPATPSEKAEHETRMAALKRPGYILGWVAADKISIGTEHRWYCVHCRVFDSTYEAMEDSA